MAVCLVDSWFVFNRLLILSKVDGSTSLLCVQAMSIQSRPFARAVNCDDLLTRCRNWMFSKEEEHWSPAPHWCSTYATAKCCYYAKRAAVHARPYNWAIGSTWASHCWSCPRPSPNSTDSKHSTSTPASAWTDCRMDCLRRSVAHYCLDSRWRARTRMSCDCPDGAWRSFAWSSSRRRVDGKTGLSCYLYCCFPSWEIMIRERQSSPRYNPCCCCLCTLHLLLASSCEIPDRYADSWAMRPR